MPPAINFAPSAFSGQPRVWVGADSFTLVGEVGNVEDDVENSEMARRVRLVIGRRWFSAHAAPVHGPLADSRFTRRQKLSQRAFTFICLLVRQIVA